MDDVRVCVSMCGRGLGDMDHMLTQRIITTAILALYLQEDVWIIYYKQRAMSYLAAYM